MPFADVPAFVATLRATDGFAASHLLLEFLILTAVRTSEVLHAKWPEIDMHAAVWTIPAERMKAKREHRVPLTARCTELLKLAREISPLSDYVFTGRDGLKPASNMTMLQVMKRAGLPFVPQGFRSSFRDWASETTNHPRDVCEMALAHTISNRVEAAYRRGDLFDKRRLPMADWSDYIEGSRS
jgi:integrase